MELDKRILEGKKPLTALDTDVAKEFIGKQCYFADNIEDFSNLDNTNVLKEFLTDIDDDEMIRGCFISNGIRSSFFCHFIVPCEWVKEPEKEPEKKYRSFTLAEWIEQHEIGEVIHYRNKSEGIEFRHMYMGYAFGKGKDITKINVGTVTLGVANYSFDYLFEDYEIEIDGEWLPFGVIEDD